MPNQTISAQELLAEFTASVARSGVMPAQAALIERLSRPLHSAEIWTDVIAGMVRTGFTPVTIEVADVAMRHFPQVAGLLYWRANALRMSGRQEEAEQGFRALLQRQPDHREAALSLAFMLREAGRIDAAAQVVVALARKQTCDAHQTTALLAFLRECAAYAPALEIAQAARERWPADAPLAAITGEIALALGEFELARATLREAVARDPNQAAAWLRLAHCQRYTDRDDVDVRGFQSARADRTLSARTHVCAGFALGKALDDLGDPAAAARVLRDANAQARSATPWRAETWRQFVADQTGRSALPVLGGNIGFTPVFIVGLPRTGTTLAAATLGRHPQLRDRGELNWIGAMHTSLTAQGLLHDPSALESVCTMISTQMRRDDAPAQAYIDKNPLNFRYLDLIAAIFPNAKIIHCRRNRRDTALSLWMQYFAHDDAAFAYDFASIAEMAAGYERLMAHWRQTLTLPVFDLDYETMVSADPENLERLMQFLGVASGSMLQAPISGAITTASVWQVRQPLHTHSIGRWRNYANFVPELAQLFADA